MKILIVHTYYRAKGGEDTVFEQESAILRKSNIVENFAFSNKGGVGGLLQFLFSIWNIQSNKKLKAKIKDFNPDVIHIHNWHFAAGPLIIRGIKKMRIPLVLTLHNYRLLCPSGTLCNDDHIFLDSLTQIFPWKAIRLGVYRNSSLQTFWLAFLVFFHRVIGTWAMVDRYIVLTSFAKTLFKEHLLDIPEWKFIEKANFFANAGVESNKFSNFLFVGRLTSEKGINVLLEALGSVQSEVRIAGTGPEQDNVERLSEMNSNLKFLGSLTKASVLDEMKKCSALIFPSIWYEGMPMTIIEAFSTGTPVIASNLGSMATMISDGYNGLLFNPNDSGDLIRKMQYWESLNSSERKVYQDNARLTYENFYKPDQNCMQLEGIYREVIEA